MQPLPDPQSQLPQPKQLRKWGLLSPDRLSLVPPGTGRGEGSGPRTHGGSCTPLLQRGPRAREDLEGGHPVDKKELGSAASRGSPPPPPASPLCPRNKEPFRTQGSPSPPSCLMPAHQAGGPQLSGPRDTLEGTSPGSLAYPLCGALGSSLITG